MGQGYSLTTLSAAAATIDVPELGNLVPEKTLASARFMKSIRARNQQGFVFVKAVMKPYPGFDISKQVKQILEERSLLLDIPNALGYSKVVEVGSGGFLLRQFINNSVYDRLSTRPFLEDIEKKWLAFQLLSAVRDCHSKGIHHGDIKTENLLVTSWNWLFLTDFSSSFKPATLPEDNPADFSFYFDTSGRRTCYLAPERFTTTATPELKGEINWAMDIFSVGCTMAEIFLEGPIFSLSQIFKYRTGDYSPEHTHLSQILDLDVREMVRNMIDIEPEKRYSAEQYLSFYRSRIFPDYFYSFLHQYMLDLTGPSYGRGGLAWELSSQGESDDKIDRVYSDFDKVSYFLGHSKGRALSGRKRQHRMTIDGTSTSGKATRADDDPSKYDGTLLFLTVVVCSIRNTTKASAKLKACDLLVSFAGRLPDEAKLDRVLPYLNGLLSDRSDIVKAVALRAITSVLEMVQVVSPINAYVFPEYIFPKLQPFVLSPHYNPSTLTRTTYASCLASLALSSTRILDMVQAIRADGRLPSLSEYDWAPEASYHGLFDVARAELVPYFEEATKALITDPDPAVRRAFLGSVSRLCVFFGSPKANDVILSHLNTYLNDKDWILKCSFLEALVGVGAYVGSSSLERFILPIMIQTLTDPEYFVVERVFRTLARMSALGLISRPTTWELISIAARYFVHPSYWIRESAVQFVSCSSEHISQADRYCIVLPIIQPFLRTALLSVTEENILGCLKSPLQKQVFEFAMNWAKRDARSAFWEAASREAVFVLPDPEHFSSPLQSSKKIPTSIPASQRSKEDHQPLETLRTLGLTQEDEMKLLGLREYIYKVARVGHVESRDDKTALLGAIIPLTQIDVTPQNVFFDSQAPIREIKSRPEDIRSRKAQKESHTITDALMEASTTLSELPCRSQSQSRATVSLAVPNPRGTEVANGIDEGLLKPTALERSPSLAEVRPSSDPERLSFRQNSSLTMRHRNSAISLMSRKDAAKADAETSTTSENAFGKLDGPLPTRKSIGPSPLAMAGEKATQKREATQLRYEPNHSYTGNDPNVLRLLENHFVENLVVDELDFGPRVQQIDSHAPIRRATDPVISTNVQKSAESSHYHNEPWYPAGQLLALFSEHTAAVNRVVAAPDHAFFVTISDDGSCKAWDTTRLEKNITPRSRLTHKHGFGAKVKALCFVQNTHAFVSAADDGSINAVKVDHRSIDGGENVRYGKPVLVRDWQIPPDLNKKGEGQGDLGRPEHAVWLYHYRAPSSQSVLLLATSRYRILAVDLKTMDVMYVMSNPIHHGTPTTFVVDKKHHWLLLATTHGILDLWDLRFRLRLRSFGLPTQTRIDSMVIHPNRGHGKWVIISAGGEISTWDIEKCACKDIYRPSTFTPPAAPKQRPYEAWYPDEEPSEKILERFAQSLPMDETLLNPSLRPDDPQMSNNTSTPGKAPSTASDDAVYGYPLTIRALQTVNDTIQTATSQGEPVKTTISFLLSAGLDRTIRHWDLSRPELSKLISGPQLLSDESNTDVKTRGVKYVTSHPLEVNRGGLIGVTREYMPGQTPATEQTGPRPKRGTPSRQPSSAATRSTTMSGGPHSSSSAAKANGNSSSSSKPPRNTVISAHAQQLLRTHMDGITDLIVLRRPYGCVVSVDRAGCVFVFQ